MKYKKIKSSADLYAIEMEEALIGSIIVKPEMLDVVVGRIQSDSFFDEALGALFSVFASCRDSGTPIDIALIRSELKRLGIYNEEGIGANRLAELFRKVPHAGHAFYYAQKVAEAHKRRLLIGIGETMIKDAMDADTGTDAILETTEQGLDSVRTAKSNVVCSIATAAAEVVAELEKPRDERAVIFTGLDSIDNRTLGGFAPGEVHVVAARPSCGKTALGWQISFEAARRNIPTLFVSLEMGRKELILRAIADVPEIDSKRIRAEKLTDEELHLVKSATEEISGYTLWIADPPAATVHKIRSIARMEKAKGNLRLMTFDYIGLVDHPDKRLPRFQQITDVSRQLKQLAKELEIPILLLCQVGRKVDLRRGKDALPRLSDLRDSGAIEQDADSVSFLHPNCPRKEDYLLLVEKNRHGPTGRFDLRFDKRAMRFVESSNQLTP